MPNSIVYTNNQNYQDIANAIRSKNGSNTLYYPTEMAEAIRALVVTGETLTFQTKTATPTTITQEITADSGYTGLSKVTINPIPSEYLIPSGTITITGNGQTDVTQYASVIVNVEGPVYTNGDSIGFGTIISSNSNKSEQLIG